MNNTYRIHIALVRPGMVVAEDIYSFSDQLIISAETVLTDRIITRLKFYSITELLVYEQTESSTPVSTPQTNAASPSTEASKASFTPQLPYSVRVKHSPELKRFSKAFSSSIVSYRTKINSFITEQKDLNVPDLLKDVSNLFDSAPNPSGIFDMLMCIRDLDDVTFVHGLNVALICNVFAVWLKLSKEDTDCLILSGLLHDIGKILIPKVLLNKPASYTPDEYTAVKAHSLYGFNLLKDLPLDDRIKNAALMHHERCDGSGYPMGLSSAKIDSFAKIVAIADVYDAMTACRAYRGPICPLEVIGIFESEGLHKYDPKYLLTFLEGVVTTYLHHTVELTNGEKGEIIMINPYTLSRPVLHMEKGHYIDLSREPELSIVGIA